MQKDFLEVHNDYDGIIFTSVNFCKIIIKNFSKKKLQKSYYWWDEIIISLKIFIIFFITSFFFKKKKLILYIIYAETPKTSLSGSITKNNCVEKKLMENCCATSSLYTFNNRFGYVDFVQCAQDGFARTHKIHVSSLKFFWSLYNSQIFFSSIILRIICDFLMGIHVF